MSEPEHHDDDVSSKHRREKKELQAKIQSLKKSASKGDKKKRKEILDEISKLEIDLDKRQSEELNNLSNTKSLKNETSSIEKPTTYTNCETSHELDEQSENSEIQNNTQRISKAQKRRNKKVEQERIKEAEIAAQEELNKSGPRMLEILSIKKILKERRLKIYTIPSDGDCLYNAICHQMSLIGRQCGPVSSDQNEKVKYLRNSTANYILENKDSLIFYMPNQGTDELVTDEEFELYCDQIRNTPAWGGQIEIRALANILKVPIEVLQSTGPPTVQASDDKNDFQGPNLVLTYHRHMYSLGEHYNSTTPLTNDDDEDEEENED